MGKGLRNRVDKTSAVKTPELIASCGVQVLIVLAALPNRVKF